MPMTTLSERLTLLRECCGAPSVAQFACELGITEQELTALENGRSAPTLEQIERYSRTINVNLNWLLNSETEPFLDTPQIPMFKGNSARVTYYWKLVTLISSYGNLPRHKAMKEALYWLNDSLTRFNNPDDDEMFSAIMPWTRYHISAWYSGTGNDRWKSVTRTIISDSMTAFHTTYAAANLQQIISKSRNIQSKTLL